MVLIIQLCFALQNLTLTLIFRKLTIKNNLVLLKKLDE